MKMHRFLTVLLLITAIFVACGSGTTAETDEGSDAVTVIYLSRHAEKGNGNNPALLPAGKQRAERLAKQLGGQNIAAVYATDYVRTQSTGAPLARVAGVPVTTYSATANPAKLTKDWLNKHRGKTIFVVGHSNTIPGLVNALVAGARYSDMEDNEYNRLFRVTVDGSGKGSVRELSSGGR